MSNSLPPRTPYQTSPDSTPTSSKLYSPRRSIAQSLMRTNRTYPLMKADFPSFCADFVPSGSIPRWMSKGVFFPLPSYLKTSVGHPIFLPAAHKASLKAHVSSLLQAGIISPSRQRRHPFLSYPFLVPKGDRSSRIIIVIDYSHLAPHLSPPPMSLPNVFQIVRRKPALRPSSWTSRTLSSTYLTFPHSLSVLKQDFCFQQASLWHELLPLFYAMFYLLPGRLSEIPV